MDLNEARSLWHAEPGWLNTATHGLPPETAYTALTHALERWRAGRGEMEEWQADGERARASFGRLVGVPVTEVMSGQNVSGLLAPFAAALPAGSRVVVPDIEFTSNLFPWLVHQARGVEVVTAAPDKLADAIDERTTAVAFSLVQSAD